MYLDQKDLTRSSIKIIQESIFWIRFVSGIKIES